MHCAVCPRKCNVDRTEQKGFCGETKTLRIARAALHFYEEPIISGTFGSGAIFFSGCNLKCVYCQNYELSRNNIGQAVDVERLAEIFKELEEDGAANINLVTPTHFYPQIIEALELYRPEIPVVYNCCGYETTRSIRELSPYVDVFLTDFKYIDGDTAKKYSNAADYPEVCIKAISEMINQKGKPVYDEYGMLKSGVIIRHLVLPSHIRESVRMLEYIKANFADAIPSVMFQYIPMGKAELFPEINRKLTGLEIKTIRAAVERLDFPVGFIQDPESADAQYIPEFDYTGVKKSD